jgi:hypothetical protein
VTTMKDKWQLKCMNTSCTAGVGGAPFRTPALIQKNAIAYLGLHRDSAHGDNVKVEAQDHQPSLSDVPQPTVPGPGKDAQPALQGPQLSKITCKITQTATTPAAVARLVLNPIGYNVNFPHLHLTTQVHASHYKDAEETAERTDCPTHTSLDDQKILQPATQPTEAPEVTNTKKNRSLEGTKETKQAAPDDKEAGTDHTEELASAPAKMKVGRNDEEEYAPKEAANKPPDGNKASEDVNKGRADYRPDAGANDKPTERNDERVDAKPPNDDKTSEDNNEG